MDRDHVLSAYRFISLMRYVPDNRKILIISEDADNVMIFDEKFRLHTQLYPSKVQVIGNFSKVLFFFFLRKLNNFYPFFPGFFFTVVITIEACS